MSNVPGYNNGQYAPAGGALRYRPKDGRYMPQQVPVQHGNHNAYIQGQVGHQPQGVRSPMPHGGAPVNRGVVSRQQQQMMQQQMQHQMLQQQHQHPHQQPQQPPRGGMVGRDGISLDNHNEFPSLGGSRPTTYSSVATVRNTGAYETQRPSPEFDLNEASFPALPSSGGTPNTPGTSSMKDTDTGVGGGKTSNRGGGSNGSIGAGRAMMQGQPQAVQQPQQPQQQPPLQPQQQQQQAPLSRGRRPSVGGNGSESKAEGANRQYGILGLLDVIRMSDPALHTLTLGVDLSTIGLNINSQEFLHSKFSSPWSDAPTTGTPAYVLPMCYQMGGQIATRTQHFPKFQVESLFYIFYTMPLDVRQGLAAEQLYKKKWRFHKQWKLWFTPNPNAAEDRRRYLFFDRKAWEQRVYDSGPDHNLADGFLRESELQSLMSGKANPLNAPPAAAAAAVAAAAAAAGGTPAAGTAGTGPPGVVGQQQQSPPGVAGSANPSASNTPRT